jgi:hypothetical protein
MPLPAHLKIYTTPRGLARMPTISGSSSGIIRVYESSAASEPRIWLQIINDDSVHIHLTAEAAWKLAEQIMHLVKNHYQGDATPEDAIGALTA